MFNFYRSTDPQFFYYSIRKDYNIALKFCALKDSTLSLLESGSPKTHVHPYYMYKLLMTPLFAKARWCAAFAPLQFFSPKLGITKHDVRKHISTPPKIRRPPPTGLEANKWWVIAAIHFPWWVTATTHFLRLHFSSHVLQGHDLPLITQITTHSC